MLICETFACLIYPIIRLNYFFEIAKANLSNSNLYLLFQFALQCNINKFDTEYALNNSIIRETF